MLFVVRDVLKLKITWNMSAHRIYIVTNTLHKYTHFYNTKYKWTYLNNGRVLGEGASGLGWLTNCEVFYITSSEDDVLKHFISRWNRSVSGAIFSAKRANCWKIRKIVI